MKFLLVDDDRSALRLLQAHLADIASDLVTATSGSEALSSIEGETGPVLAILDWVMPPPDGLEVIRLLRAGAVAGPIHAILVTADPQPSRLLEALAAGADDFLRKPLEVGELRARVGVGMRLLEAREALARRVVELEAAAEQIQALRGLLPTCSYCRLIRDEKGDWKPLERLLAEHAGTGFTHGICPSCLQDVRKQMAEQAGGNGDA